MKPATLEAARLMCRGAAALSAASSAGIRIDVPYMQQTMKEVKDTIRGMEAELRQFDEFAIQRKIFGEKVNHDSDDQLRRVFFKEMGYVPKSWTSGGEEGEDDDDADIDLEAAHKAWLDGKAGKKKPSMDETALLAIGTPFTAKLLERKNLTKLASTYIPGILKETVDGYMHPNQTLHKVVTYRGACEDPNFTNIPIRDDAQAKYIRRGIISRQDHVLLEMDLKANEVRVACCYHKDPTMFKYIMDDYDMHLDMARECFILPGATKKEIKTPRDIAKSFFVFAEFYGSYYVDVARNMWEEAEGVTIPSGLTIHDHLKSKGIVERGDCVKGKRQDPRPGTFELHIQQIEKRFWGERFPVYDAWRKQWWADYLKNGWFHTLTGFSVQFGTKGGLLKRNEAINNPVQGSAFHCLLWGLIRLGDWLRANRMRSVIVGQIHDSLIIDAHKDEWQDVAAKFKAIMVDEIREHWKWLILPLGVESSMSPTNWYEKETVDI